MKSFHDLAHVGYYRAPGDSEIKPHAIAEGFEYIELVTAGKVFFEVEGHELEFGCGAMFWHLPSDCTIHKTDPDNPYERLCLKFSSSAKRSSDLRTHPRVSVWRNKDEAVSFSNIIIDVFHNNILGKKETSYYAYSRLSWEAGLFSAAKPSL